MDLLTNLVLRKGGLGDNEQLPVFSPSNQVCRQSSCQLGEETDYDILLA